MDSQTLAGPIDRSNGRTSRQWQQKQQYTRDPRRDAQDENSVATVAWVLRRAGQEIQIFDDTLWGQAPQERGRQKLALQSVVIGKQCVA